jgi:hypothetical protein
MRRVVATDLTRQTQQVLELWRLVALSSSACHFWFQRWVRELTDAPSYVCLIWSIQYPVNITRFRKTVKTAVSFVVSACPSVRMEKLGYNWTDLMWFLYLRILRKSVKIFQFWFSLTGMTRVHHPWQHESSECKKFVHFTHLMYCLSCRRKMQR